MSHHLNKGFTLVELLVIISIIGLISAFAVISFISPRQQARDAKRVANIATLERALEMYLDNRVGYPISEGACIFNGSDIGNTIEDDGKVILRVPQDPFWHDSEPTVFNGGATKDYAASGSVDFCYWYYGTQNTYYISYYLESNSKSGNNGIHVITN